MGLGNQRNNNIRRLQHGAEGTPGTVFDRLYGLGKRAASGAVEGVKDIAEWYDDATTRGKEEANQLREQAGTVGGRAATSYDQFQSLGGEANTERDYLRRIARGQESVSAQNLQNSLQQNQAAQQSMAAGARPGNAAMAARQAAMNAARQGAGLAGQQATAGIQERQAAQQSLANMLMQQRQQELSSQLGSQGQSLGAYEQLYSGAIGQPTGAEKVTQWVTDLAKWRGIGKGK